ncbi:hypothetical protein LCGC14_1647560 [marine sediment metagenome]|uniref:Uncharacterized protein n=1 Tax=marine sediment metagenome TaxID=412755 RepID=A0A0F9KDM0_9ZZZZ
MNEDIINDDVLNRAYKKWENRTVAYMSHIYMDADNRSLDQESVEGTATLIQNPDHPLTAYSEPLEEKPLKELKIEGEFNYLSTTDDEIQLEGEVDREITLRYRGLKIVIRAEDFVYIDITKDD